MTILDPYIEKIVEDVYKQEEKLERDMAKKMREVMIELKEEFTLFFQQNATDNAFSSSKLTTPMNQEERERYWRKMRELRLMLDDPTIDPLFKQQLEMILAVNPINSFESFMLYAEGKMTATQAELNAVVEDSLVEYHQETYHRQLHLFDMALIGVGVTALAKDSSKALVREPWLDLTIKDRMIAGKNDAMKRMRVSLNGATQRGEGARTTLTNLLKTVEMAHNTNKQIAKTETSRIIGDAGVKSMKQAKVEKYQFLATLDNRTSKICQSMDGKVFNLKDREVGRNASPLHVNCRSTEAPFFDDIDLSKRTRIGKDADGNYKRFKASINYAEWKSQIS